MTLEILTACRECRKPPFVNSLELPHSAKRSERFRQAVGKIEENGPRDILVTPSCLDSIRLSTIGSQPLSRIMHFGDRSGPKIKNDYFGIPVLKRSREIVAGLGAKQLFIVSADYCDAIYREVAAWDIPGLEIIPLHE